jgi:hypothetical protein
MVLVSKPMKTTFNFLPLKALFITQNLGGMKIEFCLIFQENRFLLLLFTPKCLIPPNKPKLKPLPHIPVSLSKPHF